MIYQRIKCIIFRSLINFTFIKELHNKITSIGTEKNLIKFYLLLWAYGGIGRRKRLKTSGSKDRPGSTPGRPTLIRILTFTW